MSIPDTPQVALLRSLTIRPKQVLEFAAIDLATLETVVADARQRSGIRDIGGWVVSILRDIQDHGWEPAAAKWQIDQPRDFEASLERWRTAFRQDASAEADSEDTDVSGIESAPPPVAVDWAVLEPVLLNPATDLSQLPAYLRRLSAPPWIPNTLWQRLRPSIQWLLIGSRLDVRGQPDGTSIIASDMVRQQQLANASYRTAFPALIEACKILRE